MDGAKLPLPENWQDLKGIQSIIKTKFSSISKIALNLKYIKPKTFVNSKGEKPTYFNWDKGQPDNYVNPEEYVAMSISDGKWRDYPGHYNVQVLCVQDCSKTSLITTTSSTNTKSKFKPTVPNYALSCSDLSNIDVIAGPSLAKFGSLTVSGELNDVSAFYEPQGKPQMMDGDCKTHWHSKMSKNSWINYKFNSEQKVAMVAIKIRQRE